MHKKALQYFEGLFLYPPSRPNMNELLKDTRDFARIWDLYGHLIGDTKISVPDSKVQKKSEA